MGKKLYWISLFMIFTALNFLCIHASAETKKNVRAYSEAEQKMVDETNQEADARVGWKKIGKYEVTANDIKRVGNNFDYWNPLWDNESYALNTRYGGIIAPPFFLSSLAGAGMDMVVVPGVGNWNGANNGGMWELFKPICVGDVIRVWQERPVIEDVTEGDGARTFDITTTWSFINQNDEKVSSFTSYLTNSFSTGSSRPRGPDGQAPSGQGPAGQGAPGQGAPGGMGGAATVYTDEDWETIDSIARAEEIRGANIRYWEDVNVGDKPKWVIVEPTTVLDMIKLAGDNIMSMPPLREMSRELGKELSKDENGVYHQMVEGHFVGPNQNGKGMHFMAFGENVMCRLITNWMGDDGWLKKFNASSSVRDEIFKSTEALQGKTGGGGHGSAGDAVIAKAEVIKKYIENGEHLVDVAVWTEGIRGNLWQMSKCTVKLISREDAIKWK